MSNHYSLLSLSDSGVLATFTDLSIWPRLFLSMLLSKVPNTDVCVCVREVKVINPDCTPQPEEHFSFSCKSPDSCEIASLSLSLSLSLYASVARSAGPASL